MSDTDQSQKTHEPTDKKLEDARKRGEVAVSQEMRHLTMFAAAVVVVGGLGSFSVSRLLDLFAGLWGRADALRLDTASNSRAFTGNLLGQMALAMGPLLATLLAFALATLFVQGRPNMSPSRLKLKWSKLSPVAGLKRLFGVQALVEFAKTLAKFTLVISTVLLVVWPAASGLDRMVGATPGEIGRSTVRLIFLMVAAAAVLVAILAAVDFVYQRNAFMKKMRMSLQEIKDEHKNSEGDPMIKAKVRAIGRQRAQSRMMAKVPTASVVITNPTHFAVALQYDHGAMNAPVVVAKGADEVAFRIREVARENGVPVVESPPLARALFASADLDRPIPTEHFKAVAAIISYVMTLARGGR